MDMNKIITILLMGCFISLTSCATIFSNSEYEIQVGSTPPGADVALKVKDRAKILRTSKTPGTIMVDFGKDGPKMRNKLVLVFSKGGYKEKIIRLHKTLDGWTIVNILFWPVFFVDMGNGSMWRPEEDEITVELEK